jgi:hypothetical protein
MIPAVAQAPRAERILAEVVRSCPSLDSTPSGESRGDRRASPRRGLAGRTNASRFLTNLPGAQAAAPCQTGGMSMERLAHRPVESRQDLTFVQWCLTPYGPCASPAAAPAVAHDGRASDFVHARVLPACLTNGSSAARAARPTLIAQRRAPAPIASATGSAASELTEAVNACPCPGPHHLRRLAVRTVPPSTCPSPLASRLDEPLTWSYGTVVDASDLATLR